MSTVQTAGTSYQPRWDGFDSLLAAWSAAFVWLGHRSVQVHPFLPGYALLFLWAGLLWRRRDIPELRRVFQSLGTLSLALASGCLMAVSSITDPILRVVAPIAFFYAAFYASGEFISRSCGLSSSEAFGNPTFRPLLSVPSVIARVIAIAQVFILEFWDDPRAILIACYLWLIPFGLQWIYIQRLPLPVARKHLQHAELWRHAFGGPASIASVVVGASAIGFLLALQARQEYLLWSAIAAILLLEALVIVQIQHLASRVAAAAPDSHF